MEHAAQTFAPISFLVIGPSHIGQPKAWVAFYQTLATHGTSSVFLEGLLYLTFGAVVVAFHNVWHGPALLLTLIGLAHILKGAGRLVARQAGLRTIARISPERAWHFQVGGVLAFAPKGCSVVDQVPALASATNARPAPNQSPFSNEPDLTRVPVSLAHW